MSLWSATWLSTASGLKQPTMLYARASPHHGLDGLMTGVWWGAWQVVARMRKEGFTKIAPSQAGMFVYFNARYVAGKPLADWSEVRSALCELATPPHRLHCPRRSTRNMFGQACCTRRRSCCCQACALASMNEAGFAFALRPHRWKPRWRHWSESFPFSTLLAF